MPHNHMNRMKTKIILATLVVVVAIPFYLAINLSILPLYRPYGYFIFFPEIYFLVIIAIIILIFLYGD